MSDNISSTETVYRPSGKTSTGIELELNQLFDSRYLITQRLGAGGMGTAYLANDQLTKEDVVIKVIHPDLIDKESQQRMIDEGVNARKIKHPNVVAVHDVKEVDGQVYLTMEHVDGQSLRNWMAATMASGISAPIAHIVSIIQEVLAGLVAAHDANVIHRDLKPENIMLQGVPGDADLKVKIIDFGIATGIKAAGTTTSAGTIGAPLYMAPEQLTMPDAVRPTADIYSVGRMFYEMLMDVLPDGMWNPPSATRSDVPPALDDVIQKALQPPKGRYPSAGKFSAAITQSLAGGNKREPDTPIDEKVIEKKRSWTWAYVLVGVIGVAGLYEEYISYDPDIIWDDPPPEEPVDPDPPPVKPIKPDPPPVKPPPPPPPVVTQSWRGGDGNMFTMTLNNGIVSGTGIFGTWGWVSLKGDTGSYVEVYNNQNQNIASLYGRLVPSQSGPNMWDYTGNVLVNGQPVGGFMFHIDH